MERRTTGKPYPKALANFPHHQKEIDELPQKYDAVLARYSYKKGIYLPELDEEDFFIGLIIHCQEAEKTSGRTFLERACQAIDKDLHEQKQKVHTIYDSHRNLYFDKCYGESDTPLSEWMDIHKYKAE